jgi:hypothetical protein
MPKNIAPRWGAVAHAAPFYKYATPLGWMIFSHLLPVGDLRFDFLFAHDCYEQ